MYVPPAVNNQRHIFLQTLQFRLCSLDFAVFAFPFLNITVGQSQHGIKIEIHQWILRLLKPNRYFQSHDIQRAKPNQTG